jgi:hypothetical protein
LRIRAVRERKGKRGWVSGADVRRRIMEVSYSVGTTRVETGRGPLDLVLFFGRHLATFEQVRDKVGNSSSLGLQQQQTRGNLEIQNAFR